MFVRRFSKGGLQDSDDQLLLADPCLLGGCLDASREEARKAQWDQFSLLVDLEQIVDQLVRIAAHEKKWLLVRELSTFYSRAATKSIVKSCAIRIDCVMVTTQELLDAVNEEFLNTVVAKGYTARSQSVIKHRLKELLEARHILQAEVADGRNNSGSMSSVAMVVPPR